MLTNKVKTLSVVYAHHEAHGPQICAIELLSKYSKSVDLLYCNVANTSWDFPDNVTLIKDRNTLMPQEEVYKKNVIIRWIYFFRFAFKMWKNISNEEYDLIVLFNPPALFALQVIYRFLPRKTLFWYHNYDPVDIKKMKKYSQGWFAYRAMFKLFPKIDLFTIPEKEREVFYPIHLLKNEYAILPNYSLLELHGAQKREIKDNTVKLIFAGVISEGNGLEEIIKLLKTKVSGKDLKLILKGFLKSSYKETLIQLAKKNEVLDRVIFIPVGPWKEVPQILRTGHIGINICVKSDAISKTLGKSGTGKTFQYIAEGLPTLINKDFSEYYTDYNWAIGTDLKEDSLFKNISYIINDYDHLSQSAVKSFKEELNCNIYFDKLFKDLTINLN